MNPSIASGKDFALCEEAINFKKMATDRNSNPFEVLRIFDVRKRPELCRSALDKLYSGSSEEVFQKIRKEVLDDLKYPEEDLCVESTFIWLYLHDRFKDDASIMKKLTLSVNEMIEYITEFVEVVEEEGELAPEEMSDRCFMLGDMLAILCYLPVEENERQAVLDFLPVLFLNKKLIDIRNSTLGVKLIAACSNIEDETHLIDLVNAILESDIVSTKKPPADKSLPEDEDEDQEISDATMRITMALVKENIKRTDVVSVFSHTFCNLYVFKALWKFKDPTRALALELLCMVGSKFEKPCGGEGGESAGGVTLKSDPMVVDKEPAAVGSFKTMKTVKTEG